MIHILPEAMNLENMKRRLAGFHCVGCGMCCQGHMGTDEGAILKDGELDWIPPEYTHITDGQRLLNMPCPFYEKGCSIYPVRPQVCRQFPFNLTSAKGRMTMQDCPGSKG